MAKHESKLVKHVYDELLAEYTYTVDKSTVKDWVTEFLRSNNLELTKVKQQVDHKLNKLTWRQLAILISAIGIEAKRRNPIGINAYMSGIHKAHADFLEIDRAEKEHPTAEEN